MKITTKYNLLSMLILSGFLTLLTFSFLFMQLTVKSINEQQAIDEYISSLQESENLLLLQLNQGYRILLTHDGSVSGEILVEYKLTNSRLKQKIENLLSESSNFNFNGSEQIINDISNLYTVIQEQLILKINNNQAVDPVNATSILTDNYNRLKNGLNRYFSDIRQIKLDILKSIEIDIRNFRIIFIAIFILILSGLAFSIFYFRNTVIGTIKTTGDEIRKLSEGGEGLNFRFKSTGKDELGSLRENFNNFSDNLSNMLEVLFSAIRITSELSGDLEQNILKNFNTSSSLKTTSENLYDFFGIINEAVMSISESIETISHNSANLTSDAKTQSEIFEKTVSEMEKMHEELSRVKTFGDENRELSEVLISETTRGSGLVSTLDNQTSRISEQAGTIRTINELMENVSAEINILSINAAIEASRAGQYGHGFKVVSKEISALALKVKKGSDETRDKLQLIIDSIENLKIVSSENRLIFGKIEKISGEVNSKITKTSESLSATEEKGTTVNSEFQKLKTANDNITGSAEYIDDTIKKIGISAAELKGGFNTAVSDLDIIRDESGNLFNLTKQLEINGKKNMQITEALTAHVNHFTGDENTAG